MTVKLMGKKKGMTRLFDEQGQLVPCSVIEAEPNVISQIRTVERDGYTAIQLGGCKLKESRKKNLSKPLKGHFAKANVEPRARLQETRVESVEGFEVGQEIGVGQFAEVSHVDVAAVSKGKGYQGVMKRHNFSGGPAAHGSGFHRHAGSTGMRSTPGHTLQGVKMAGRMGGEVVTVEGLKVMKVDQEKGLIVVKGAIPGPRDGLVTIRKALKRG